MEHNAGSAWEAMVAIEPRLRHLEDEAARTPFSWPDYESLKSRLQKLVGWDAKHPALRTTEAYGVAHGRILKALESRARARSVAEVSAQRAAERAVTSA